MGTWNTNYEQLPRNKNNAGYGAPAIRELKSEISARLENEHFSGPTWETGDYAASIGFHREGSSRVKVTDPFSGDPDRTATLVTDLKVGRVEVDLDTIDTERTYNGELEAGSPPAGKFDTNSTSVDQFNQKIRVRAYNDAIGTLVTKDIFDATRFVDIKFDQLIDGLKKFEFSPEVDKLQIDGAVDNSGHLIKELDYAPTATEQNQVVKLATIKESLDKILKSVLIGSLADSTAKAEIERLLPLYYTDTDFIDQTLKIKTIEAKTVTGIVWA